MKTASVRVCGHYLFDEEVKLQLAAATETAKFLSVAPIDADRAVQGCAYAALRRKGKEGSFLFPRPLQQAEREEAGQVEGSWAWARGAGGAGTTGRAFSVFQFRCCCLFSFEVVLLLFLFAT